MRDPGRQQGTLHALDGCPVIQWRQNEDPLQDGIRSGSREEARIGSTKNAPSRAGIQQGGLSPSPGFTAQASRDIQVVACLLPRPVAEATGAQILIPGTVRVGHPPDTRRLGPEAAPDGEWNTRLGFMDLAWPVEMHGELRSCVWHPLWIHRMPVPEVLGARSSVQAGWGPSLLDSWRALTVDPERARVRTALWSLVGNRKACAAPREGCVVSIDGIPHLVLSNDVVHLASGVALVAPLVRCLRRVALPMYVSADGWRLLWEYARSVSSQSLSESLSLQGEFGQFRAVLPSVRGWWMHLLGRVDSRLSEQDLLEYLTISREEVASTDLTVCYLPGAKVPVGSWVGDHELESQVEVRATGRMFTQEASSIGGESFIPLSFGSNLCDLWLHQHDDQAELLFEPAQCEGSCIDSALVSDMCGKIIGSTTGQQVDHAGIATIPLGSIDPSVPLNATVSISTPLGVERFILHHVWRVPS